MTSISRAFYSNVQLAPAKPAICFEGTTLTYQQLGEMVKHWVSAMASRGMRRGDHVAVLLPNGIEFVALMLVAADMGLVLVPLSTSLPPQALVIAFKASDVRHVVATSNAIDDLASLAPSAFSLANGLCICVDGETKESESLESMLAEPLCDGPFCDGQDDDPFILTMTSGSTGDPKPIVLSQLTKWNRVQAAARLYAIDAADRILAATPLYHSLAERLVLIPLLTGGTSVLMARFSPTEWLNCVDEQCVTFTIAVSSQLKQLSQHIAKRNDSKISSLRCVVSSSAHLDPLTKTDLLSKLRCDFHECYGASEIAIASNLGAKAPQEKRGSVGNAAPGVDIVILDSDSKPARRGEVGEIACKTSMIFAGYYKRPDITGAAMWGDYFRTGDLGKLDEDGFLYFLGRKKEIIITGGINVYPADIEFVVLSHPSVFECAAFPLADEQLGEIVAVAIVPRDGATVDMRRLRIHCAMHLADYQQPRRYVQMESLPKNAMGKIIKHLLPELMDETR